MKNINRGFLVAILLKYHIFFQFDEKKYRTRHMIGDYENSNMTLPENFEQLPWCVVAVDKDMKPRLIDMCKKDCPGKKFLYGEPHIWWSFKNIRTKI